MVLLVSAMQADVGLFAHRRRKRPFDRDLQVTYYLDRLFGKLRSVPVQPFEAGVQRAPGDGPLAGVGFVHGRLDHVAHHRRDVQPDSITAQHADDRVVADDQLPVPVLDQVALGDLDFLEAHLALPSGNHLSCGMSWRGRIASDEHEYSNGEPGTRCAAAAL